jgi:hypothetical protein
MTIQRRKRLQFLIEECYREMYRAATPSADYDKLLEEASTDEWGRKVIDYNSYYLDSEKFEEIANKYKSKMKMYKPEEHAFSLAVYLGSTPTSSKKFQNNV